MSFDRVIANMFESANKNNPIDERDYEVDGLKYCYKCNTPKQFRNKLFGGAITGMPCKCEREADEENKRKERAQRLRERCFSDKRFYQYTFANDDGKNSELTQQAKFYVEIFDECYSQGKGLLLLGDVGYGKTFMAGCIANALIDKGKTCCFTNFSQLSREWEGAFGHKEEILTRLKANDLLVIDDWGAERDKEYVQEMVKAVVEARLEAQKPLLVTTNLTTAEFCNPSDTIHKRIYSRLYEMSIVCICKGEDRRKTEFAKTNQDFRRRMEVWSNQQEHKENGIGGYYDERNNDGNK